MTNPRRRGRSRPLPAAAEVLEDRTLLTHFSPVDLGDGHGPKFIGDGFTTVTEDFSDNPNHEDPATVGGAFDALEAQGDRLFTHTQLGGAGIISINDADIPFDQVEQGRHHVFALVGTDEIAFNGIHPEYHVSAARVDAIFTDGTMQVEFHGANGVITLTPSSNNQWETLLVTRGTIIPNTSTELGPISQVVLRAQGTFAYFDNVRILISSSGGPQAFDGTFSIPANERGQPQMSHDIPVVDNSIDPEGRPLTIAGITAPSNGTAVIDGDVVRYTPNTDFRGVDQFDYTIRDESGQTDTATITLRVGIIENQHPVANDGHHVLAHGTTGTILVGGGATDPDNDPLAPEIEDPPQFGTITFNPDLTFNYTSTHPDGLILPDSFTFRASDGVLRSNLARVTIEVPNAPPVGDVVNEYRHGEQTPVFGSFNDDPDGDELTYEIVTQPAHGSVRIDGNRFVYNRLSGGYVDWLTGEIHNNDPVLRGDDSFTYRATDPYGATSVNTATILVENEAPETNKQIFLDPLTGITRITSTDSFLVQEATETAPFDVFLPLLLRNALSNGRFDWMYDGRDRAFHYSYILNGIENLTRIELGVIIDVPDEQNPSVLVPTYTTVALLYSAPAGSGRFLPILHSGSLTENELIGPFIGDFDEFTNRLRDNEILVRVFTNDGLSGEEGATGNLAFPGDSNQRIRAAGKGVHFAGPGPLWNDSDIWYDYDPLGIGESQIRFDPLGMHIVKAPEHGVILLERPANLGVPIPDQPESSDGSFTYYPEVGFEGIDRFTYVATDGHLFSEPQEVTIEVLSGGSDGQTGDPVYNAGHLFDDEIVLSTEDWRDPGLGFNLSEQHDTQNPLDNDIPANNRLSQRFELIYSNYRPFGEDNYFVKRHDIETYRHTGNRIFPYVQQRSKHSSFSSNIAQIRVTVNDLDQDGDGLTDSEEGIFTAAVFGPKPWLDPNVLGDPISDSDDDGVSNAVEHAAPNNGDGNNDGTPDIRQDHVTSLPDINGNYVTIVAPPGTDLANVVIANSGGGPSGVDYPIGHIKFRLENVEPGAQSIVEIILHDEPDFDAWYKFGRTADNPTPHWYEFDYDGRTGAELIDADNNGTIEKIILHLRDGERGDDDLTVNGTIVDPGGPVVITGTPTANADLSGEYAIDGQTVTIEQTGGVLTFTNEHGDTSTGRLTGLNHLVADGWQGGLVAEVQGGLIKWANGTTWAVANLAGDYSIDGESTTIVQMGAGLTFINERGETATGRMMSDSQVVADDWEGGLVGHVVGNRIDWTNGTTWSAPDIAGEFAMHGQATQVEQAGNSLTFINQHGDSSRGWIVGPDRVFADDWDMFGEINKARIEWSNGTAWNAPQVSGGFSVGGEHSRIFQRGTVLTFVNERFESSTGRILDESTVIADDWDGGLVGEIVGREIQWSNGTTWSAHAVAGDYTTGGQSVEVLQQGNALTFINENGEQSKGRQLSETRVIADDWGRLIGERTDDGILWSNGTLWETV